ncbi:4'-phosphopantetheinyl transferase superfamily protein [Kribbella sp. NPDC003505]|uniref:4'-phosphopantetheinyl transferase family protein n=1 Tax=Kribbella sp. NPDC003505 TaxID=3154448 RepID=UPI0033A12EA4
MGSPVHVRLASAGSSAHELLLDLAGTLVDRPSLRHDDAGRPHIPGLAVSVTYSQHRVAVAASYDGPLGVDLEEITPRDFQPLANRWFTQRELDWMVGQRDRLEAFLQLWTAKEAVGKALGAGLRGSGLRREMPLGGGQVESAPGLSVTHLPCAGGVLALAAPTGVSVHLASPGLDPVCARG